MFITLSLCTFSPLNPYHPAEPSEHDIFVGQQVANCFQQAFHTLQFQLETPHTTGCLPVQQGDDVVNCGIFVLMYIMIFMSPNLTIEMLLDRNKIFKWERYRVLLQLGSLPKWNQNLHKQHVGGRELMLMGVSGLSDWIFEINLRVTASIRFQCKISV